LLMSDSYLPGAAVLAHSLRDARTSKKLAVLVTLDNLSTDTITALKDLYDYIIPVDRIRTPNLKNLYLMDRADLAYAFTKIALWRQTQFRKIVYIDADVVALRAPDELFDIDASFAAAPDVGWPDCFNTGVMVIKPDMGEYWALKTLASAGDSFDGADQGLLNQYYEHKDWHRLSFTYNCTPNAQYQWEPAYRYFKRDIAMVHFIGKDKPWTKGRQSGGNGGSGVYNELLGRWWAVYDKHLNTNTDYGYSSISHLTSQPQSGEPEAPPQTETPFSEAGEVVDNIETGHTQPVPTVEQRRFSAPQMEWDATRSAPPPESKPEAEHFPTQQYTFSDDKELFHAPQSYPEPPKDMWYEVPEEKPAPKYEPPKPIFPWEQDSNRPKPTRVFVEDLPPPPQPGPESISEEGSSTSQADSSSSPSITSPRYEDPWQAFTQSKNAWDAVPGIDSYVRAVKHAHERRGKPHPGPLPSGLEGVLSPSSIPGTKASNRQLRRESLILTDFPSADERPSLPVTPAPIRRPTFWGDDRDEAGELPGAEGVPDQIDWVCPNCGFTSDASSFARFVGSRVKTSEKTETEVVVAQEKTVKEEEVKKEAEVRQEEEPKPHERRSSSTVSNATTLAEILEVEPTLIISSEVKGTESADENLKSLIAPPVPEAPAEIKAEPSSSPPPLTFEQLGRAPLESLSAPARSRPATRVFH
ncbi:glycosyltransferase family 8 protein, partial [Patellaria atrata CBS 101060]